MIPVLKTPFKESFQLCVACVKDKESFSNMAAPIDLVRKCEMCSFTDFITFSNDKNDTCFENFL